MAIILILLKVVAYVAVFVMGLGLGDAIFPEDRFPSYYPYMVAFSLEVLLWFFIKI